MRWLSENCKWLFDGVAGAAVLAVIGYVIHRFLGPKDQQQSVLTAQGAKVTNSPVASGTNISQTINSQTLNLSLPAPTSGTPAREKYEEWHELEELAGQLVEELASYRPLDQSTVAPKLVEYRQAAGRFARHDNVRRAILQLQNSLDRMFAAKRDRNDDEENLRSELDRDLKKLLSVCDQVTERD